jgi:pantetheine-phosphate adenylyltransferase
VSPNPPDGAASRDPGVRRCVCPGSYDPVTNGHLDVIERASTLFDEVVVAVLHNPAKRGAFAVDERVRLVQDALHERVGDSARVRVEAFAGRLLVDVCREVGAVAVVKGLRGSADLGYELPMALMNRHLTGLETVFLAGDPTLEHVSSSLVKEVAAYGGDVTGLVPDAVRRRLEELRTSPATEGDG